MHIDPKCHKCKKSIYSHDDFCPNCGVKITEQKKTMIRFKSILGDFYVKCNGPRHADLPNRGYLPGHDKYKGKEYYEAYRHGLSDMQANILEEYRKFFKPYM